MSKLGTTNFVPSTERPAPPGPSFAASSPFPLSGTSLSEDSKFSDPAFAGQPIESHLKRQSLECLVSVLRSLVAWAARGSVTSLPPATPNLSHSVGPSDSTSSLNGLRTDCPAGTSEVDLNATGALDTPRRGSGSATPEIGGAVFGGATDDPSRFENAKLRKTTLLEGIKKFNFKPKRVCF